MSINEAVSYKSDKSPYQHRQLNKVSTELTNRSEQGEQNIIL